MNNGVTIVDPRTTWIDVRAEIGQDTIIYPFSYINGRVIIGERCVGLPKDASRVARQK